MATVPLTTKIVHLLRDKGSGVLLDCIQEQELAWQKPAKAQLEYEGGAEASHGKLNVVDQKRFGGYDCEFVEPTVSVPQTECPICKLILRDPYITECCGTSFCCSCVEQVRAVQSRCPICREDKFEFFPNTILKHSLNKLHVLCTYSKRSCKWRGKLGELNHHMNEAIHSGESFLINRDILLDENNKVNSLVS